MKKTNSLEIIRYEPDFNSGLSLEQVEQRKKNHLTNEDKSIPSKTIPRILFENICTLFNLLNFLLALSIFVVGSYKNLLFMGVIICNTLIGSFQEIRAKKTVDKLSLISASKTKVIRNSKLHHISVNDIVLDDIICFDSGDQITTDCIIVDGFCNVNESLLTGESDSIYKKEGDMLLSGSYIISGNCKAKAEHVGSENYASKIAVGAKYIKKINSEIMSSLNLIIKIISFLIIPIGLMLFYKQVHIDYNSYQNAVVNTVAALIGMIPEGLILLTSTVLAVGVVRLSKHKVLVQELYCIETLARVDVLCLDKTGTITEGNMKVKETIIINNNYSDKINDVLSSMSFALKDNNHTINAIRNKFGFKKVYDPLDVIPFSSEKKWSGVYFKNEGSYIIGAKEFIFKDCENNVKSDVKKYSFDNRILILAHSKNNFVNKDLPKEIVPVAYIVIEDKIRSTAKNTLDYFKSQNVNIKVISGDNPLTVSNIAKKVGVENFEKYIDMSSISSDTDVIEAAKKYSIFGRVSPEQKKKLVVALKKLGHTVAMTGDGVNDVLALKEADCSIAMANGSDAAKSVSQLVLLNSCFDSMTRVVDEGRRSINNIQRSSSLFLVKTIYSLILSIIFIFINSQYPFSPIQMTLINVFTIGIPSFVLALEPNKERINGRFFINVIKKSAPAALTVIFNIIFLLILKEILSLDFGLFSTLSVILTGYTGLLLLFKISLPLNNIRKLLLILMISAFSSGIIFGKSLFSLTTLDVKSTFLLIAFIAISTFMFLFIIKFFERSKLLNKR